jgi:potassium-transporting ATPase potassium-binding subunit
MMATQSLLLLGAYLLVLLATVKPLGLFFARFIDGPLGVRFLDRLEARLLRLCGVGQEEMSWRQYAGAVLLFSLVGVIAVYALQRLQRYLPLNPQHFGNVTADSSFNTAVSFGPTPTGRATGASPP